MGSTKQTKQFYLNNPNIPDASGNNHDITMFSTGIVAGTFDASIAKLASLIASSNA